MAFVSAAMVLSACAGGSSGGTGDGASSSGGFDAAVKQNVNPSTATGGVLKMAQSGDWDSVDPADTYYGFSWNFARLYGRALVTFGSGTGADSIKLVPDLASSLGKSSDDGKTWTYTLRDGVKFEDGTPITSKDVAYAVSRSLDKDVFVNGPTYFNDWLDLKGYRGPFKDKGKANPAIETPDAKTIIFHLKKPFSGFDYFAQLPSTMPVPQAKDTGSKYKQHVVASGPYMFKDVSLGKSYTLVKNPNWDAATDPIRKQLVDEIDVAVNANADDVDNRLLAGTLDVDIAGAGVQPAAQAKILSNPELKKNSDIIPQATLRFTTINPQVAPFDNIHCRKAVEYAVDKTGYQRAYGGATGGQIATNLLPPLIPGSQKFDLYPSQGSKGDVAKAKAELAECGKPNGFSTNLSFRAERPKDKAAAQTLQQSLARVGIKTTLKGYPASDYASLYAGNTQYQKKNSLGMSVIGWIADWPEGYGFLEGIVDPRGIKPAGNTNYSVTDPAVGVLIDKAIAAPDTAGREQGWVNVDKKVMEGAYIIPGVWASGLYYRPPNVTNVHASNAWAMYEYLNMGVAKK